MGKNKNIAKNIIWLVYDKVFGLLLNLFVTVKIVNHFGADEYGLYAYAVSVVTVLGVIVSLVEARVTKKQYALHNPAYVIFNSTVAKLILSIITLLVGLFFMFIYKGSQLFNTMFVILLFNTILTNLRFGIETHFEYNLQSKSIVVRSNVAALVAAGLQIFAVYNNFSIVSLCLISTVSVVVSFFTIYLQFKRKYKISLIGRIDYRFIKVIIMESIPLAIAAAAATVYTTCGSILIGHMLGTSEVGVYAVGLKLFNMAQIAIVPVRTSLFPKQMELYQKDKKRYKKMFVLVSSAMTWLCIVGMIISFTAMPMVFNIVFSSEYIQALSVFNIHLFALLFLYNSVLRTGHYTITNSGKILMYTQVICVMLNIILNVIFIPIIGIYGAAVATVVTQISSLLFSNNFFPEGKELFIWQMQAFNPKYLFEALRNKMNRRARNDGI